MIKTQDFICEYCSKTFTLTGHSLYQVYSSNNSRNGRFCSNQCNLLSRGGTKIVECKQCNKSFKKRLFQIKKTNGNHFCSQSCAAIYNNLHKKHGTRRSKLEVWIEEQLPVLYPTITFLFNDKSTIGSELDIYIPSLKLAFELNGIYHYEPIHGQTKLDQIQNNDNNKFMLCQKHNISLCIIDCSNMKNFKVNKATKYLDIIANIIDDIK